MSTKVTGGAAIEPLDDRHVAAGIHEINGLYWTKVALSELPNDLISVEDLKRCGIALDRIDVAAVRQR